MRSVFYVFIIFISGHINSQTAQKIKFQKDPGLIYFFPKSADTISITKNLSDLFYLIIPDPLKKSTVLLIDNGQLVKTANDSIVKINYIKGIKYEAQFVINEMSSSDGLKKEIKLISLIDGTSAFQKNKIRVQILNKKEDKIIMENSYIYKTN